MRIKNIIVSIILVVCCVVYVSMEYKTRELIKINNQIQEQIQSTKIENENLSKQLDQKINTKMAALNNAECK